LLRWAASEEKDLYNEKILKRKMREAKIREEDIDLILNHLKLTNKMTSMEAKIGNQETRILKLGAIKGPTPVISDKEKA
jgi:hypothetical protein